MEDDLCLSFGGSITRRNGPVTAIGTNMRDQEDNELHGLERSDDLTCLDGTTNGESCGIMGSFRGFGLLCTQRPKRDYA